MIATDRKFKDIHAGEECMIIGGGYREGIDDSIINPFEYQRCKSLDKYQGRVIGCNSAFKVRKCDYIVLKDKWVWNTYKNDYKLLEAKIFYVGAEENSSGGYIRVVKSKLPRIGVSFNDGVCSYLSGYSALHIALLMGFSSIYLTGFSGGNSIISNLSRNFIFFTEWITKYDRKIYITEKNSILKEIFPYERPKTYSTA